MKQTYYIYYEQVNQCMQSVEAESIEEASTKAREIAKSLSPQIDSIEYIDNGNLKSVKPVFLS